MLLACLHGIEHTFTVSVSWAAMTLTALRAATANAASLKETMSAVVAGCNGREWLSEESKVHVCTRGTAVHDPPPAPISGALAIAASFVAWTSSS